MGFEDIKLIKASAGSGKTYRLMKEIGEMVTRKKNPIAPDHILATTFTIKAAAELKERIRMKLLENGKVEEAHQVSDSLIGTVDSICARLIKEYAIDDGLPPQMNVIPTEQENMIFNTAVAPVFAQVDQEFYQLASRMGMNDSKKGKFTQAVDWREKVLEIVKLARSNNLTGERLKKECADLSKKNACKLFPGTIECSLNDIKLRITKEFHDLAVTISSSGNKTIYGSNTVPFADSLLAFERTPTWHLALQLGKGASNPRGGTEKYRDIFLPISSYISDNLLNSKELQKDVTDMIDSLFCLAATCLEIYHQYKQEHSLIDFIDQETQLLALLDNKQIQAQLKERISQIMVDEFQDTSPIQLALFLKLHKIVGNSLWVGDPKQAIYGFRGTDPILMQEVARQITSSDQLPYSWRSREHLIQFSNAVFKAAFNHMKEEEVCLTLADEEKDKATRQNGTIESWMIPEAGQGVGNYVPRIAMGIRQLKMEQPELNYGDIAVLFRSNSRCAELAKELAKWGIPAAAPAGKLNEMTECQLVMSAFRYAVNRDRAALTFLGAMLYAPDTWVKDLVQKPDDTYEEWKTKLENLPMATDETPLELIERVMTALQLDVYLQKMTDSERRVRNVAELKSLARHFMDEAGINHVPATLSGFIKLFMQGEQPAAIGIGGNCVQVLTYHKSKGLEWPVVILGDLNSGLKKTPFDVAIVSQGFDPETPLDNRYVQCILNPFGTSVSCFEETDKGRKNEHKYIESYEALYEPIRKDDTQEARRLMYVGMTRAKDTVILAVDKSEKKGKAPGEIISTPRVKWIDLLTDDPCFAKEWKFVDGESTWTINKQQLTVRTRCFSDEEITYEKPEQKAIYSDLEVKPQVYPPAHKSPSMEAPEVKAIVRKLPFSEKPMKVGRTDDYDVLGTLLHNYLELTLETGNDLALAADMITRMGMEKVITPEVMAECRDALRRFIDEQYPGAISQCEVPVTMRESSGTLYQGFIDLLLKTADGYVIVDHKSHPNPADAVDYALSCVPQVKLYATAVEAATGQKVLQTLIHLPILGQMYDVI